MNAYILVRDTLREHVQVRFQPRSREQRPVARSRNRWSNDTSGRGRRLARTSCRDNEMTNDETRDAACVESGNDLSDLGRDSPPDRQKPGLSAATAERTRNEATARFSPSPTRAGTRNLLNFHARYVRPTEELSRDNCHFPCKPLRRTKGPSARR